MRCLVGNIEKVLFFSWGIQKKIVTLQVNLFLQNKKACVARIIAPIFCVKEGM